MEVDPLEEIIEDDDFRCDEDGVTAPAPGVTQGAYVGKYSDSGLFPKDGVNNITHTELHFSAFTTFSLFACLIVMMISAIFLICMFLGYV